MVRPEAILFKWAYFDIDLNLLWDEYCDGRTDWFLGLDFGTADGLIQ